MEKFWIARNKNGELFKFPYSENQLATEIPHKHICGYPFDGNYYVTGKDYQPQPGIKIDNDLFPEVTYENSPIIKLL